MVKKAEGSSRAAAGSVSGSGECVQGSAEDAPPVPGSARLAISQGKKHQWFLLAPLGKVTQTETLSKVLVLLVMRNS